ncbi:MAG: hypothetical protein FWD16_03710, partial [Clostridia bacterium]|nr:hypothetical protein [Clostridia bacterium]
MHTSQPPRHWSSDRAGGYSRSGKAGRRFLIIGMTALVFVLTVAAGADTYRKMGSSAGFERVPPILSAETPLPPTDEPVQSGEPSTALPVFNGPFEKPPRCKVEG